MKQKQETKYTKCIYITRTHTHFNSHTPAR